MVYFWKVTSGSEEEDNIIGPMPAKGPVESDVTKEFERRAQRMKEKLTSADSVSWVFSPLAFCCWSVLCFSLPACVCISPVTVVFVMLSVKAKRSC